MQIKRILEQPQNILLQTLVEAVHVPVCIDGHPDSKEPKWKVKSWREDFTLCRTAVSHLDILPKETAAKKVIRLVICMHTGDVRCNFLTSVQRNHSF